MVLQPEQALNRCCRHDAALAGIAFDRYRPAGAWGNRRTLSRAYCWTGKSSRALRHADEQDDHSGPARPAGPHRRHVDALEST